MNDDRIWIFSYLYGKHAFLDVIKLVEHLEKHGIRDDHELYFPMITAIYTSYSRPFKKGRMCYPLPDMIVPDNYKGIHQQMIESRDKLYAHTDAEKHQYLGHDFLHAVRLSISYDGFGGHCLARITPRNDFLCQHLPILCRTLAEKCTYHIDKICMKNKKKLPNSIGLYDLITDPHRDEFYRRVENMEQSS